MAHKHSFLANAPVIRAGPRSLTRSSFLLPLGGVYFTRGALAVWFTAHYPAILRMVMNHVIVQLFFFFPRSGHK